MTLLFLIQLLAFWNACSADGVATEPFSGIQEEVTFESEEIAYLYAHYDLGNQAPVDTLQGPDTPVLLFKVQPGLPGLIAMQMHPGDHIGHIGLHLFTAEELESLDPVGRFLERYLLSVYAQDVAPEMALSVLKSHQISIKIDEYTLGSTEGVTNDVRVLPGYLQKHQACTQEWKNYEYTLICSTNDDHRVTVQMPANGELLVGKDKKELQEAFNREVLLYTEPAAGPSNDCARAPASLIPQPEGLFRSPAKTLHPGIRSEIYYLAGENDDYDVYRGQDQWLASLNNLLMCPPADLQVPVRVEHNMYGNGTVSFEMPLGALLGYFQTEGFDTYVGFERSEDQRVRGTVVFRHRTFDYNQMLVIEALDRIGTSSALDAGLYTFIRNDNLQSLYGSYVDRKGEKIPVIINPD